MGLCSSDHMTRVLPMDPVPIIGSRSALARHPPLSNPALPLDADDDAARLLTQGKITAQGKLLLQDTLLVMEQSAKAPPRADKQAMKERRVFLFEQIVIFSEEIDKRKNNMSSPGYIYKNSIKVRLHLSQSFDRD